jgi:hypothetical protein
MNLDVNCLVNIAYNGQVRDSGKWLMCDENTVREGFIRWDLVDDPRWWKPTVLSVIRRPNVFDLRLAPMLRRFLCVCCREIEHHLTEPDSRSALEMIERFAYGKASFDELVLARDAAKLAARRVRRSTHRTSNACAASEAVCHAGRNNAFEAVLWCSHALSGAALSIRRQAEIFESMCADWFQCDGQCIEANTGYPPT